jgi:hypothetical protein
MNTRMWSFAYDLLYVASSRVGVPVLISLVVLDSTFISPNVRFAWYACAGADSYSSDSLAGACQFVVSIGPYSIGKHVSRSSVSYSFNSSVDRYLYIRSIF